MKIEITDKTKKEKVVSFLTKWDSFFKRFTIIEPFMLIFAFVIVLPTLKPYLFRWLLAFLVLAIAVDFMFKQLRDTFPGEVKTELLIRECSRTIEELQSKKKKLIELNKKKEVKAI